MSHLGQFMVIFYFFLPVSDCLECYQCSNVTSTNDCRSKVNCTQGQRCFTSTHGVGVAETFQLGCKSETNCLSINGSSIVGGSAGGPIDCVQCCQIDGCNKNLCASGIQDHRPVQVLYPSVENLAPGYRCRWNRCRHSGPKNAISQVINNVGICKDDPTFDCARVSSIFNICSDVHHAKLNCRKYCGLCHLIDGMWSVWSSWSGCDVTCGSGHMTRTRDCTNPAPAHGGLDCDGNSTESTVCVLHTCTVNGSWAAWSSWGHCSVSCGMGLQRRTRSCSNPPPTPDGIPCSGNSSKERSCFLKACADGMWSRWSSWSVCSTTDVGGVQKRSRSCNNPAPSFYGKDCVGVGEETKVCNVKQAQTGLPIAFRATTVISSRLSGHPGRTLIYQNIYLNSGGGYGNSSGAFTAPEPGIYLFIVQVCVAYRQENTVSILRDGRTEAFNYFYDHYSLPCGGTSVILILAKGERVWPTLSGTVSQSADHMNFFQGTKLAG